MLHMAVVRASSGGVRSDILHLHISGFMGDVMFTHKVLDVAARLRQ